MDPDLSNEEWSMNDYYKKDDEKAPLNIWWNEIYDMNELAVDSLSDRWLGDENNGDTRKLAESFFGIQFPNGGASLPREQDPKFANDLQRLRQARGNDNKMSTFFAPKTTLQPEWYAKLDGYMGRPPQNPHRTRIMSDPTYLRLQTADMPLMNTVSGEAVKKNGKIVTLGEHEASKGRQEDFEEVSPAAK